MNVNTLTPAANLMNDAKAAIERSFVRKAAMTTTDITSGGGLLAPQQAKQFIRMLRMKPYLLRAIRMVALKGPTDRIDRIGFNSRILHAASENTNLAAGSQSVPTTSKVEMSAKLYKAEVQISYETLQDTIEGGINVRGNKFENLVFQLIAGRVALDLEEIALLSDTGSAVTDYAQFNGWIKLAQDSHSYDHSGATLSKAFFKQTFLELPQEYRQNKNQLMWVISSNMDTEWGDELADAGSTQFAQSVPWGAHDVKVAYGVPMVVSAYMPSESGSSSNLGKVLITHPQNAILGIWRNIFMEVDRDIRSGTLIIVVSVRIDAKFEQVEGACVGTNVIVA